MRRSKITLLKAEPRNLNVYAAFAYPGLALPLLATRLRDKGYDVKAYVESIRRWDWSRVEESDLVGLTVNSAEVNECYELARQIRARSRAIVVMGGYHVTYLAEEALDFCDVVVRGEGEDTFAELVDALLRGDGGLEHIAGISYRQDAEVVHNPDRPLLADIDLIPDQSIVEGYREHHRRFSQRIYPTGALVASSRGCPYDCTFCSIIQIYKRKTRYRSSEAVIEDIRRQTALTGHPHVYFVDDNFTANPKRCKRLLRDMIDAKLDVKFSAQARLEFTRDDEFVRLMKEAGCYMVFIGFESLNAKALEEFRKRQTVEQIRSAIERLRKERIHVHGMFVIGGDHDDADTARKTAEFAVKHRLGSVQFLPLYPLPGTVETERLARQGRLLLTRNPQTGREGLDYGAGNSVLFRPKRMSAVALQRSIMEAYEVFYTSQSIAASMLQRAPLLTTMVRILGRGMLKEARREVQRHVDWLLRNGLTEPWAAAECTESKASEVALVDRDAESRLAAG